MAAAALWVLSPSTAQASSITVTLNYAVGLNQGGLAQFNTGIDQFDFRLTFDQVQTAFSVDVKAEDQPNLGNLPPGYTCVPINGGHNCIMFTVTPSNPTAWIGNYTINIAWQFDTNGLYPNDPVDPFSGLGRIRILHFDSSGMTDITLPNYCSTCGPDPAIGGKDNNFSDFIVAQTPGVNPNAAVPEPATMVLLGTGLVVLAVRLRRRRV
jgi:hypothetical protein